MQNFADKVACDDHSSSKVTSHAWLSPLQLSLQVAQSMKHDLMEALDAMKKLSPLLLAGAGQASWAWVCYGLANCSSAPLASCVKPALHVSMQSVASCL